MKDIYVLNGRDNSSVRELQKESDQDGIGLYTINSYRKDNPDAKVDIRVGLNERKNMVEFVDFAGGPMITPGYIIEEGITVLGFTHENFTNIKVILENGISD